MKRIDLTGTWLGSETQWLDVHLAQEKLQQQKLAGIKLEDGESWDWYMKPAIPYQLVGDVGVVSVEGSLVAGAVTNLSHRYIGVMGYDNIAQAMVAGINDEGAKALVLDVKSCGGMAFGCYDAATNVMKVRQRKPVVTYARQALSAAYWLAAMGQKIVSPMDGSLGSIGAAAIVAVRKRMLEEMGVDIKVYRSHDHKARVTGLEDLGPEDDEAVMASQRMYVDLFVRNVSLARGIPEERLRADLGGKVFWGAEAKTKKFGDVVGNRQKAFEEALKLA